MSVQDYLRAYDDQLRTEAETAGAERVERLGPLWLATFGGSQGFVSYRELAGADAPTLAGWVDEVVERFAADPAVEQVEWKTRGHDVAPGLHEALVAHGFEPQEPESVMVGEAALLDVAVPLPASVSLRRIRSAADVQAMAAMQDAAFGNRVSGGMSDALLGRLAEDDGLELWVAEADGAMVGAGRLEPVAGSDFAGVWGGAVLPQWRGRGIYRALTAVRARAALASGKTLIHSDSTPMSRPILERSGLVAVSTTTPYEWHRRAPGEAADAAEPAGPPTQDG
ncbi:GNAT family N-acetyltransferase [Microlunatus sagamiharensis]|nr:GNAT family N-acetyltransferase [Microlunatus sagamiharensis]